jgi:hypothetical protein
MGLFVKEDCSPASDGKRRLRDGLFRGVVCRLISCNFSYTWRDMVKKMTSSLGFDCYLSYDRTHHLEGKLFLEKHKTVILFLESYPNL